MAVEMTLELQESVPLAPLTTFGVGGAARWFAAATTPAHVAEAHARSVDRGVPFCVLGGGSNLIVADDGFNGVVVRVAIAGLELHRDEGGTTVIAGAGESWDQIVAAAVARGVAGLECLSGIPGTVGGTPIQNVGAYGQEVAETIESVTAFDLTNRRFSLIPAAECGFAYRTSRFKREPGRFVVTAVTYRLNPGPPTIRYPDVVKWLERAGITTPALEDVRAAVLGVRRSKGMVVDEHDPDSRSVGSFFMNPVVSTTVRDDVARVSGEEPPAFAAAGGVKLPAAWLIERAGFPRGTIDGAVGISTKHPLALINRGGATARDVLRLATRIKRQVIDRFGVSLRPEPIFIGFGNDPEVTYLRDDG